MRTRKMIGINFLTSGNNNYHYGCSMLMMVAIISLLISGSAQEVTKRRTTNTCRDNIDCPTYAYCDHNTADTANGQCICQEGYIIALQNKSHTCFKVGNLNDPCSYDDQCMYSLSTEAECRDFTCQCRSGTHYVAGSCYKTVKVGDFCRLTNNCIGSGTVCRSGVCQCPMDTHPNEDNTDCLNNAQLGDPCSEDFECIAENSRCHDLCRCVVSHAISKDGARCLPVAGHLGENCEENHQCEAHIANSVCARIEEAGINGTCNCRQDYHSMNQKCWVTVNLGGICEEDENCAHIANAKCVLGRCDCAYGLSVVDGQCSGVVGLRPLYYLISLFLSWRIFY